MKKTILLGLFAGLTTLSANPASAIFNQQCASCHGANAERSALGQSQVIAGWDKDKLMSRFEYYITEEYKAKGENSPFKGIMTAKLRPFSHDQLQNLAELINSK